MTYQLDGVFDSMDGQRLLGQEVKDAVAVCGLLPSFEQQAIATCNSQGCHLQIKGKTGRVTVSSHCCVPVCIIQCPPHLYHYPIILQTQFIPLYTEAQEGWYHRPPPLTQFIHVGLAENL